MPVYLVSLWKVDDKIDVAIASLIGLFGEIRGRTGSLTEWSNICDSSVWLSKKALVLTKDLRRALGQIGLQDDRHSCHLRHVLDILSTNLSELEVVKILLFIGQFTLRRFTSGG
jgi:hypothetical protein